jgi:hypothetical protein
MALVRFGAAAVVISKSSCRNANSRERRPQATNLAETTQPRLALESLLAGIASQVRSQEKEKENKG